MVKRVAVDKKLAFLQAGLRQEILDRASVKVFPDKTELIREGQYVKVVPVVLRGLIKVFVSVGERELLLYYIGPEESCIMSFAASLHQSPSRVFAITEEETEVLLLPADQVSGWVRRFPSFNTLFYQQYHKRYEDLLQTIQALLLDKLDARLMKYLTEKAEQKGSKQLNIRHREIAAELGTAREVVTRILKKLESEGRIRQMPGGVIIIEGR